MKLLSKPEHYDFHHPKSYTSFRFFRFALTERNWTGEWYVSQESCRWFMEELKKLDEKFYRLFGNILHKTRLDFLMDTSVFAMDFSKNEKIIRFLEELTFIRNLKELEEKKYKSRLFHFANQVEHLPYLYHWALSNPLHPFYQELYALLEKNVSEHGLRSKNFFIREAKKLEEEIRRETKKKKLTLKEQQVLREHKLVGFIQACEKRDQEFIEKALKYALSDPSLFFYAVYMILTYFKQLDDVYGVEKVEAYEFLSIQRKGKKIELFLRDSNQLLDDLFLTHEAFLNTLPKTPRNTKGVFRYYRSLVDLQVEVENEEKEQDHIAILQTIVQWVTNRIPYNQWTQLPHQTWIHKIKNPSLLEAQVEGIHFDGVEIIGGPFEHELLIKAIAYYDGVPLLFPIFDPHSWHHLNSKQCMLLAYAICLFHDICIEHHYELIPLPSGDRWEYELVTLDPGGKASPLQTLEKGKSTSPQKKSQENKGKKKEYWVSFHFRRLTHGYQASDEAKQNALKYGIKELPKGFTFVDAHIRGEGQDENQEMKISALEVLNRTLQKLQAYYEKQDLLGMAK